MGTAHFPTLRCTAFLIATLIPAVGAAQVSHWIPPANPSSRTWTDPLNWSNGVPNAATATAVFEPTPMIPGIFQRAIISGAEISVAAISLSDATLQVGGDNPSNSVESQAATLTVTGAGIFSTDARGRVEVANGTLRFAGHAMFASNLHATTPNSMFRATSTVLFTGSAVDRGHISLGGGRASGRLEFRDQSILDGGTIGAGSFAGESLIVFRDQSFVNNGLIRVSLSTDHATIRIQDAADTTGLAIAGAGTIYLDVTAATKAVTVKSITGNINLSTGRHSLRVQEDLSLAASSRIVLAAPAATSVSVGGTATVGGSLDLGAFPRESRVGTHRYPVLTASRLNGRFSMINGLPPSTAMLKSSIDYSSTDVAVLLQQLSFANVAGNSPAATALGLHLDATHSTASGRYFDLVADLNSLATSEEVRTALETLTPDRLSEASELGFANAASRFTALERQFTAEPGVFFSARYTRRERSAEETAPATSSSTNSGMVGGVWHHGPCAFTVFLEHGQDSATLDSHESTAENRSSTPGLQLRVSLGKFHLAGGAAFTKHDYQFLRRIDMIGADPLARSATTARQVDLNLNLESEFQWSHWHLTASGGILHSTWMADDFAESSGGTAALQFQGWQNHSSRSRIGFDLERSAFRSKWRPHLAARWLHEFERDRSIPTRFASSNTAYYRAAGLGVVADEFQAELGLRWQAAEHFVVSIDAELRFGKPHLTSSTVSIGGRWQL